MITSKKKQNPEKYKLIQEYFELKDQLNCCDLFLEEMEQDYNLSIVPRPQILIDLQKFFRDVEFVRITNLHNNDEIEEMREIMGQNLNKIQEFQIKLQNVKIKIKKYFRSKKGFEKDEEIQEVKNITKKISKDIDKLSQSDWSSRDEEELDSLEDVADFCNQKIDKNTENLINLFCGEKSKIVDDIYKAIEPDLLIIAENKDDQQFLEEAEINEQKIEDLGNKLKDLKAQKNMVKKKIHEFQKRNPNFVRTNAKQRTLKRSQSVEYNKTPMQEELLSMQKRKKDKKLVKAFLNEMTGHDLFHYELKKQCYNEQKKQKIVQILESLSTTNQQIPQEQMTTKNLKNKVLQLKDQQLKKQFLQFLEEAQKTEENDDKIEMKNWSQKFENQLKQISKKVQLIRNTLTDVFQLHYNLNNNIYARIE